MAGNKNSGRRRPHPGEYLQDRCRRKQFSASPEAMADPVVMLVEVSARIVKHLRGENRVQLPYTLTMAVREFMPPGTFRWWEEYAEEQDGEFAKEYSDFLAPIARARDEQIALRINAGDADPKAGNWQKFMLGNMDPTFRESHKVEITGKDGGAIETAVLSEEEREEQRRMIREYYKR